MNTVASAALHKHSDCKNVAGMLAAPRMGRQAEIYASADGTGPMIERLEVHEKSGGRAVVRLLESPERVPSGPSQMDYGKLPEYSSTSLEGFSDFALRETVMAYHDHVIVSRRLPCRPCAEVMTR